MLAQTLITDPAGAPNALNFAPDVGGFRSASDLVEAFAAHWEGRPAWELDTNKYPHEASLLMLDATRARRTLGWRSLLSFEEAVSWTADWYRSFWNGDDVAAVTRRQIDMFAERLGADSASTLRGPA